MTAAEIDALLRSRGIAEWGVANMRREPGFAPAEHHAPDLPQAFSIVARHEAAALAGVDVAPTPAYYADYNRLNALLNDTGAALVDALSAVGHEAELVPSTVPEDDYDLIEDWGAAGVFAHKTAATRAGLGWIGKTALFVSERFGPWVRLATVFTDLALPVGTPIEEGRCGACRACVDACPADAGRDVQWRAGMSRDELYGEKACEVYTERFDDLGGVCGNCMAVCPLGLAAEG
jgi:epoxyqueuosine reductase QueG